ncbi:MAG: RagB/SusD family nutrient uptake outer membrane protein [Ferruginibacter sp.]
MKKLKLIFIFFALILFVSSCKKTSILDQSPQDQYSDPVLWSDIALADAYLLDTYHGANTGFTQTMLSSVTDEAHSTFDHGAEVYVQGNITPDNPAPWDGSEYSLPMWDTYFAAIQKLNVLIVKIDGVADVYPQSDQAAIRAKAAVMKGEALFLRAFCYAVLVRTYGGVPILKEPLELGGDFKAIARGTFEETVNAISEDCDAAAALLLKKDEMLLGRATKGAALALKSRVLLFAASDLTADGTAQNKYVGYESPDRTALWTAARNAAKAVIDLGSYQLADFGAPNKVAVAQNYYNFFKAKDLSDNEVIWGKMYSSSTGDKNEMNQWNGGNGWELWASNAPTQNLVDAYEMEDGSGFSEHFKLDASGNYQNISSRFANKNPYYNRDPRFYGSILYDSAAWMQRPSGLQTIDPIGLYNRRTRITISGGTTATSFGLDTRQSPISPFNGSFTGYVMKKMLDNESVASSQPNENVWIELRYAEVLLNYAEAAMESGQIAEATTYLNMVRNRAGLPVFTGDINTALRYERRVELVFENARWYDIRRWKILEQALSDAKGVDIVETNTNGSKVTVFKQIAVEQRQGLLKMYWIPISSDELRKAPGLTQNPGY